MNWRNPKLRITKLIKTLASKVWEQSVLKPEIYEYMQVRRRLHRKQGVGREESAVQAWRDTIQKYPPIEEDLEAIYKKARSDKQRIMAQKLRQQLRRGVPRDVRVLPKPMAFAFLNLHCVPDPDDPETWAIMPEESPNAASWNMLMLAAREPQKFMQIVTKEMIDAKRAKDKAERDEEAMKKRLELENKQREIERQYQIEELKLKAKMREQEIRIKEEQRIRAKMLADEERKKKLEIERLEKEAAKAMEKAHKKALTKVVHDDAGLADIDSMFKMVEGDE